MIANGGVSVVTAILVEPAGTFVPDGTEVFFFTNLGRVDASGKTINGVARVNFVSDARSGKATVTAISGGPAPAPTATPAATQSGVTASAAGVTAAAAAVGVSAAAGQNSATVEISIGSALPDAGPGDRQPAAHHQPAPGHDHRHRLRSSSATPCRTSRSSSRSAAASSRRPWRAAARRSSPTPTGRRATPCVTKAPAGGVQKTVTVTATTANGIEGSVTVFID